jgi:hypothetical protein
MVISIPFVILLPTNSAYIGIMFNALVVQLDAMMQIIAKKLTHQSVH